MQLSEKTSKKLGVNYLMVQRQNDNRIYLCENGVIFSNEEYLQKFHTKELLEKEYEKRYQEGKLYDYAYAKETGELRLLATKSEPKEEKKTIKEENKKTPFSIIIICLFLTFTALGSMAISTVHTYIYLQGYFTDVLAFLMSAVITVYCAITFEIVFLFWEQQRTALACILIILWAVSITVSMASTVSIFYDQYVDNSVTQVKQYKDEIANAELELLKKNEQDIRASMQIKLDDMEFRRKMEYPTTKVRTEYNDLQTKLSECLEQQKEAIKNPPKIATENIKLVEKETLFKFIGRKTNIDGDIFEFLIGACIAVFINIIAPMCIAIIISLLNPKRREDENNN